MFSGRWDRGLKRDSEGSIFLDVTPAVFELVLSYLRAKAMMPDATFPEVPGHLKVEMVAFLGFMALWESPSESNFSVIEVSGSFCGGEKMNYCAPNQLYTREHVELILRGRLPDSVPKERQAIYTHPSEGEHSIKIKFPKPYHLRGMQVMMARESACIWSIFADDERVPFFSEGMFQGTRHAAPLPQNTRRIVDFDKPVKAEHIRFVVHEMEGNIGIHTWSFF
eukprot:TRINITY_DN57377_c0_g1_i1.p1 TRINITY_DN57377_c0_g1~~TRINITY_DN57377_c0_g1_i1.p1  ORF type:complete len:241 (+),score=31.04 TRINITY_DN57377_c0_g1_i1:56-724(+)